MWNTSVYSLPFCRYVHNPLQFFKELGIPGPKPKPLIGNLDLFRKFDVSLAAPFRLLKST